MNTLWIGVAIVAVFQLRATAGTWLIAALLVIQTAFLTQLQTYEPRSVLVYFPALLAMSAQLFRRPRTT